MKTLAEALEWRRLHNDRRLALIEEQEKRHLSGEETTELQRLQAEAEEYASLYFMIRQQAATSEE